MPENAARAFDHLTEYAAKALIRSVLATIIAVAIASTLLITCGLIGIYHIEHEQRIQGKNQLLESQMQNRTLLIDLESKCSNTTVIKP